MQRKSFRSIFNCSTGYSTLLTRSNTFPTVDNNHDLPSPRVPINFRRPSTLHNLNTIARSDPALRRASKPTSHPSNQRDRMWREAMASRHGASRIFTPQQEGRDGRQNDVCTLQIFLHSSRIPIMRIFRHANQNLWIELSSVPEAALWGI